jgi:hypothetical protein
MAQPNMPTFGPLPLVVLRAVVSAQCIGMAAAMAGLGQPSSLHQWFGQMGVGGSWANGVDIVASVLLIGAAASAITSRLRVLLLAAGLWIFLDALVASWIGPDGMSYGSLGSRATRYAAPLALYFLSPSKPDASVPLGTITMMLRVASAATFAVHGIKAIAGSGAFLTLLSSSCRHLLDLEISTNAAKTTLLAIGAIDLLVAGLLIGFRWRAVAWYMAAWGFATAASRITAHGWSWWPEALLRAANGGIPLALALYFGRITKRQGATND